MKQNPSKLVEAFLRKEGVNENAASVIVKGMSNMQANVICEQLQLHKKAENKFLKKLSPVQEPSFRVDDTLKLIPKPGNRAAADFINKYGQFWVFVSGHSKTILGVQKRRCFIRNIPQSLAKKPTGKKATSNSMHETWLARDYDDRDFVVVEVIKIPERYDRKKHGPSELVSA